MSIDYKIFNEGLEDIFGSAKKDILLEANKAIDKICFLSIGFAVLWLIVVITMILMFMS